MKKTEVQTRFSKICLGIDHSQISKDLHAQDWLYVYLPEYTRLTSMSIMISTCLVGTIVLKKNKLFSFIILFLVLSVVAH